MQNRPINESTENNPQFDFTKKFSDIFDIQFLRFLAGSLFVHIFVVLYFLINPISEESAAKQIAKIQEGLAKTVKELEEAAKQQYVQFEFQEGQGAAEKPGEPAPKTPEKKSEGTKNLTSAAKGHGRGRAPSGKYTQTKLASSLGNRGVLALLTSTSSSAQGDGISDFLSTASYKARDLDETLSGLSGLKGKSSDASDASNRDGITEVKGSRAQNGAGIDDLVTGLGETESHYFRRGGDLVVASDAPYIEGGGQGGSGRNQDNVQSIVIKHNKAIQHCYERELKRDPNLKGKIVVRFIISTSGDIKNVELVSSTLNSKTVERCVVNSIRRWNDFGAVDPSVGDTTIRQTYAFGY